MFIKLTNSTSEFENELIFLNVSNILGIYKGGGDYTMIVFDTCNFIVKETPEEILKLIKECKK